MKKYFCLLLIVLLFSSVFTGSTSAKKKSNLKADLIFKNGDVYTVDEDRSWAEAVAVRDDEILYVGDDEGVAAFKGTDTRVIDLKGKMLLPGFIDSHAHAYLMAESLFWLDITNYSTLEEYKQAIKDYLKEHPDIKQLRGVGFNQNLIESSGLTPKEWLAQVVPDIPAVFISSSHHDIWVNSKALENAGIDKNTPNPQGGIIERDLKTGEPTGIFREFSAQNLVISALPQPDFTVQQFKEALLAFQEMAAKNGVTSVFVPVHYPTENLLKAFEDLDNAGKLTLRYDLGLWADETKGTEQIGRFKEVRDNYQGELYKIDTIKIFSDGVGDNQLVWDQDILEETVAALDKEGFRVYIHAIGNQEFYPSGNSLDAFEYAAEVNGKRDSRHVITHLDWVREDDVARFKDLGVIPVPQPAWFGNDWYADVRGEELKNLNRMNSYFEAGIPVASSSDFPSTSEFLSDFRPFTGIEVGITRLDRDKTDQTEKALWPKEKASLEEMITSYTINGANVIFAEDERGSIEVGKKADLVVLDKNLFEIPETEINETKILLNLFEGKEVFRDPTFINAFYIKTLVEQFEEDGEFANQGVARSLQAHLDTVIRLEEREAAKRVIKHMQRFNQLLDKHKKEGVISVDAYNTLKTYTDSLIKKWQKD
ncbi:amidohydrolase [Peribacillus simplex]|uniref:Amidohydrolase n=2 Tax=Peribacillus TaxID=2675229 RepID=A0AA90PE07_9BACI|nr:MULTISPECIES: amidohydrolase [Peribacillus]MDP1418929.1 amidohydrolase [Peribacillus simplex]MDP1451622.1 amidohydrolase [Peribacillus frigoritolerans]